uniref:Uncharacterized protein n=1 Tax=Cacopsylla melanoneura TaxID=428564 RepID=A0A8D9FFQ9_9HEMI
MEYSPSVMESSRSVMESSMNSKPTPLTIIPELITEEMGSAKPNDVSQISLTPITVSISLLPVTTSTDSVKVFSSPNSLPPNSPSSYITEKVQSPSSANTPPTYIPSNLPPITQNYHHEISRNPAPYHVTESSYFGGLSHFDYKNSRNAAPPDFGIPNNYGKTSQRTDQKSDTNGFFHVPDFKIPTVSQNFNRPPSQLPQYPNQTVQNVQPQNIPPENTYWGNKYPESSIPNMPVTNLKPNPPPVVGPRQNVDRSRSQGYMPPQGQMSPRGHMSPQGYVPPTLGHSPYASRSFNQSLPNTQQWSPPMIPSHVRSTRQKIPIALPPIQIPHSFVPIPLPRKMNPSADLLRNRELHHSKYKGIMT